MVAPPPLVNAVEAAILASAHLTAYEHVAGAQRAMQRLGSLSSGRWRSAARDLERLEDDLQTCVADVSRELTGHADKLGIEEEALWAAGDAAASLEVLREPTLGLLQAGSPGATLLSGDVVFGLAVLEDPVAPDRGRTLVYSWAEPLAPASWPWQATWISSGMDEEGEAEELDLYDIGEVEAGEEMLAGVAAALQTERSQAAAAVRAAAAAFTRASLLLASGALDEPEDDEDPPSVA